MMFIRGNVGAGRKSGGVGGGREWELWEVRLSGVEPKITVTAHLIAKAFLSALVSSRQ